MKCLLCGEILTNPRSKFCNPAHKMKYRRGVTVKEGKKEVEATTVTNDAVCSRNSFLDKVNKYAKEKGLAPAVLGRDHPRVEFISSGISEINELVGGFPKKRITEIYGMQGVGKTQLAMKILSSLPKETKVLYIDTEESINSIPENVTIIHESILENVVGLVEDALKGDYPDLIIIDSVASMVPRVELEGDSGDANVGVKARLMSQWMRRMPIYIRGSNTAIVFINQQREKIASWGPVKFTPGGWALPFAASLRLELKCKKADIKETYQLVEVVVTKSRFTRPLIRTEFKLYYENREKG
jgi:recombination protein RecA